MRPLGYAMAAVLLGTVCIHAKPQLYMTQRTDYAPISADSTAVKTSLMQRFADSHIGQATFAAIPMMAFGQVAKHDSDRFGDRLGGYLPVPEHSHDYYLQLAPAALMLALKASGVQGVSTWPQMLVADAAAFVIMSGTVEGLKHTVTEWRPDGSDDHSFPSGHTATAFMTATMLHHEYGERYPWLSVAGYGMATATGFMRVHDHRHWSGDVITGAGIGIISAELGYIVSDLIFGKPILRDVWGDTADTDDYRPSFFSYYVAYEHNSKEYDAGAGQRFRLSSGGALGLEGAWFATPILGMGGRAAYSDYNFYADGVAQKDQISYLSVMAGPYLSIPMLPRVLCGINLLAGYGRYGDLSLNGVADGVSHIDARGGFAISYGVSVTLRATQSLSYRIYGNLNSMPMQRRDAEHLSTVSVGAQVAVNL